MMCVCAWLGVLGRPAWAGPFRRTERNQPSVSAFRDNPYGSNYAGTTHHLAHYMEGAKEAKHLVHKQAYCQHPPTAAVWTALARLSLGAVLFVHSHSSVVFTAFKSNISAQLVNPGQPPH